MADLWFDVDTALGEVPVNILPLIDDTDFKSIEAAVAYNASGMALFWNFVTTAGAQTCTAVTPTTSGDYDWTDQGTSGMYAIEMPASGGASANNDTEGFGWFTGVATGVLPWRGPVCGFRAAEMNNSMIDAASKGVLAPTTAARTLDVTATGGAGIDWSNVEAPTTTLALTGTTIATTQKVDLETIKTNPVVNAGTVTFPTTATLASTTNITAGTITTVTNLTNAATAGDFTATMKTSIGTAVAASAVASVTGNVGGNVTGTVGSVVGNVGGNVTGTIGGLTVGALADFFDTDSGKVYADAVAGSVVKEIATNATISGTVDANVVSISGDTTAADNAETAFDGGTFNVGGGAIVAASVTGAVGSVTGAVGSVTGNVGGNVTGSVGSVVGAVGSVTGAVGSVTGNVGGNVTGSVGSVATGGIAAASFAANAITSTVVADSFLTANKIATGAITAAKFAASAIDAAALATDAVNEIRDAIFARPFSAAYNLLTFDEVMKVLVASQSGKTDGGATTTFHIRNLDDSGNVVTATVDANGNRSAVTVTP